MELEGLAGGDAQAAFGMGRGDGVELQPLFRSNHAARGPCPDHEGVRRLEFLQPAFLADIAIVLLVTAVVLDQYLVVLGQRSGHRIGQGSEQSAAQAAAGLLDVLDRMRAHQYTSRA